MRKVLLLAILLVACSTEPNGSGVRLHAVSDSLVTETTTEVELLVWVKVTQGGKALPDAYVSFSPSVGDAVYPNQRTDSAGMGWTVWRVSKGLTGSLFACADAQFWRCTPGTSVAVR